MQALARLGYPRRVVGLVPASENLPSGTAQVKPGDILRAMSGKTVEVINTDAEGRLILADALSYAVEKYQPACIIDLATHDGRRGGRPGAPGHRHDGHRRRHDDAACARRASAALSGSGSCPCSTSTASRSRATSRTSRTPAADATPARSSAGVFLKEFVGDTPWVHLDIAGMAWTREGKPYVPKGSTGWGIRLLVETLESLPAPSRQSERESQGQDELSK